MDHIQNTFTFLPVITVHIRIGHYVPQLVERVYDYNKATSQSAINLKGFIVGNAVTDNYYDNIGTILYWWTYSMISIMKTCDFKADKSSEQCDKAVSYALDYEFGDIDSYNIYTSFCNMKNDFVGSVRLKKTILRRRVSRYNPCTENYAKIYYNRPDVQRALHAYSTGIPYKWTACSDVLIRNWNDSATSSPQ